MLSHSSNEKVNVPLGSEIKEKAESVRCFFHLSLCIQAYSVCFLFSLAVFIFNFKADKLKGRDHQEHRMILICTSKGAGQIICTSHLSCSCFSLLVPNVWLFDSVFAPENDPDIISQDVYFLICDDFASTLVCLTLVRFFLLVNLCYEWIIELLKLSSTVVLSGLFPQTNWLIPQGHPVSIVVSY